MTCIAGFIEDGKAWIGGDSAGVAGLDLIVRADEKVFRNDVYVMGFTTSFRMGQLLRYAFTPPAPPEVGCLERFMVTTFIDALRQCLIEGGFASKHSGQEEGGTFIVGYRDRLWTIDEDYQVGRSLDGIVAVGCGKQIALGALYATQGFSIQPKNRLSLALSTAERYSGGVRAPFTILHT